MNISSITKEILNIRMSSLFPSDKLNHDQVGYDSKAEWYAELPSFSAPGSVTDGLISSVLWDFLKHLFFSSLNILISPMGHIRNMELTLTLSRADQRNSFMLRLKRYLMENLWPDQTLLKLAMDTSVMSQ